MIAKKKQYTYILKRYISLSLFYKERSSILAFKEATLENDKLSSNINPTLLENDIKNKLEVKLNRLRGKNYNTDRRTNDENDNIGKLIKRAGK